MATFYVGQRVRIVFCEVHKGIIGMEATITSPLKTYKDGGTTWLGYGVSVDGYEFDSSRKTVDVPYPESPLGVMSLFPPPEYLEPILRPDNEIGDWAELGFHPSQFQRVTS